MQGDSVQLMNYGSELPNGIIGSAQVGMGGAQLLDYNLNPLNGADFSLLQINIGAPTAGAVTTIPNTLVASIPLQGPQATVFRNLTFAPEMMDMQAMIEGPFTINEDKFDIDTVNITCHLNDIEIWTLNNQTQVAHPFHIHDVQFYILDVNGSTPQLYQSGKKDVVLVMPMETVSFITRFEDFADDHVPYMYHCHLLHHEDDGMMGSFAVVDTSSTTTVSEINSAQFSVYPNPTSNWLNIVLPGSEKYSVSIYNSIGAKIYETESTSALPISTSGFSNGIYFISIKSKNHFQTQKFIKQ